jgi:hypothetical protein
MKKLIVALMALLLCAVSGFSSVVPDGAETDDLSSHVVVRGESIWKISFIILDDALMDTSVESVCRVKNTIVVLNGMDPELDDGIVTFNPDDPDYIVPGQVLRIPDFLPDPGGENRENEVSAPNPVQILESFTPTPGPVPASVGNQSIAKTTGTPHGQFAHSVEAGLTERIGEVSETIEGLEDLEGMSVMSDRIFFAMVFVIVLLYSLNMFLAYKKGYLSWRKR